MTNMTIKEVIEAKKHAEECISAILTAFARTAGVAAIFVDCEPVTERRLGNANPTVIGFDVAIRIGL